MAQREREAAQLAFAEHPPHPFRWSGPAAHDLPVSVSGSLPAWLRGQLTRTAPALFMRNGIAAAHWFDGHGLLYAFEFGQGVTFRQELLASDILAEHDRGKNRTGTFGSPMQRSWFERVFAPVPRLTDNTNVNVVPWQGQWLAMTETPYQHVIGSDLRSRGHYRHDDALPRGIAMTAHPQFDAATRSLVNLGTVFGAKNMLYFFRQGERGNRRELEGKLSLGRAPYLHAFGLTPRHTLLIDHPLRVNALRMLGSNAGFIRHFAWEPKNTTKIWKLDRQRGSFTAHETEPLFCFHTVNAFEDGGDTVLDFLAYDDSSLIDALATGALAQGYPALLPKLVRARLTPGKSTALLERLSPAGFEFPQINYRSVSGRRHRFVWGCALAAPAGRWMSEVLKLDVETGEITRAASDAFTDGEPVFVPRPGAEAEDDGVLLAVGSSSEHARSRLRVLDAASLTELGRCEVELSIPLGFHGSFAATHAH